MAVRFATLAFAMVLSGGDALSQVQGGDAPSEEEGRASVSWADPGHPEINYSTPYARDLHEAGASFDGWWGAIEERSDTGEIDHVIAINFSAIEDPDKPDAALLLALCSAGDLYLAYFPRQLDAEDPVRRTSRGESTAGGDAADAAQWVATDRAKSNWTVTVQVDNVTANAHRWQSTDAANGVFIEGAAAADTLRRLQEAEMLRLTLARGPGTISSTFSLAGANAALKPLVETCIRTRASQDPAQ